jgi:DNA-binding NarL/FixJ family response regulator
VSRRPFGVVTDTDPGVVPLPPGWQPIPIGKLRPEPFDLTALGLAVTGLVATEHEAAAVLMAAVRGCSVLVRVTMDRRASDEFLESLGRIVHLERATEAESLDSEQTSLLESLAGGLTVVDAARRLGWSRRTATRRLAEAKRRLGVTSTSRAIQVTHFGAH